MNWVGTLEFALFRNLYLFNLKGIQKMNCFFLYLFFLLIDNFDNFVRKIDHKFSHNNLVKVYAPNKPIVELKIQTFFDIGNDKFYGFKNS